MGYCTLLTQLACAVMLLKEVSPATWSMPIAVKAYDSYLDVTPVKYDVPFGTFQIVFNIQTGRSNIECEAKTVTILIQQGSLPHVKETNLTFPDNFMVDEPVWAGSFDKGHYRMITVIWPPPGPWFVIAYTPRVDKAIKQKGLGGNDKCVYFITSSMEADRAVDNTVIDYKEKHVVTIGYKGTLFRFHIPTLTMKMKIQVTKCDPSPCNLTLTYLPNDQSLINIQTCTGSAADCVMHVISPPLMYMQFLEMKHGLINQSQKVTFSISVTECTKEKNLECVAMPKLDRLESSRPFNTDFVFMEHHIRALYVDLTLAPFIIIPFEILDPSDIGGTLGWKLININYDFDTEITVQVCGTLLHNHLPNITEDFDLCSSMVQGIRQNFTSANKEQLSLYVPYPKIGIWHVVLQSSCFDANSSEIICPANIYLNTILNIRPCMDNGCSDRGSCTSGALNSDLVFYAACQCDAKYQGFACTDDTHSQSISVQLAGAYLLTMSNLFFAPAIVLAVRRRYFVEALVYFYNMFFSTFYHACDGMRLEKYRLCITKYDVLQVADFFGSACSLWFTLVAMARIRYRYVSPVLQMSGPLGLIIGVVYDKTSLYVIVVPIGGGLFVIITSWGYKMYKRRKLYPTWRRYLFFLLPGLALAGTGAAVFSFLETEVNYKYVHSVWHICIALSICFFLPPRRLDECDKSDDDSNMCSNLITPATTESSIDSREEINTGYVGEVDSREEINTGYVGEVDSREEINTGCVGEVDSKKEINTGCVGEVP